MAKDSKVVYGASGKTNVLTFEPESLHLVTDKTYRRMDGSEHCGAGCTGADYCLERP